MLAHHVLLQLVAWGLLVLVYVVAAGLANHVKRQALVSLCYSHFMRAHVVSLSVDGYERKPAVDVNLDSGCAGGVLLVPHCFFSGQRRVLGERNRVNPRRAVFHALDPDLGPECPQHRDFVRPPLHHSDFIQYLSMRFDARVNPEKPVQ